MTERGRILPQALMAGCSDKSVWTVVCANIGLDLVQEASRICASFNNSHGSYCPGGNRRNQSPLFDLQSHVTIVNRAQTMSDHESCSAVHEPIHPSHNSTSLLTANRPRRL